MRFEIRVTITIRPTVALQAVSCFWAIMRSRGHDATRESREGDAGSVSCLRFAYDSLRDAAVHHGKSHTYTDSTSGEPI